MTLTHLHSSPASLTKPGTDARSLADALVLRRVTDRAWQVCDDRLAPHTPGHLLGFIEENSAGVELMQLGEKFIWTDFATLDDAVAHVADTAYLTATQRAAGELAWLT
jgi:hypothetical protein